MRHLLATLGLILLAGCGARTDLDVAPGRDAGPFDAGPRPDGGAAPDAGDVDGGPPPPECVPEAPVVLARRRVELLFVIDRSSSMTSRPDGEPASDPIDSRWIALREALRGALIGRDDDFGVGAIFYPDTAIFGGSIELACSVREEIDLPVAFGNGEALIAEFEARSPPQGATPTAVALEQADRLFSSLDDREVARFVVLATDGGPNCNPTPEPAPPACVCVSTEPLVCDPAENPAAGYYCLDDARSVRAVQRIANDDVPVFVIGITDEEDRPELRATLDSLAVAGGRPQTSGPTRYYDVRNAEQLAQAMSVVTDSISRCTFYLPVGWQIAEVEELTIDGNPVPRDRTRTDGWDLTDPERGELTLYGSACDAGATATLRALPVCR